MRGTTIAILLSVIAACGDATTNNDEGPDAGEPSGPGDGSGDGSGDGGGNGGGDGGGDGGGGNGGGGGQPVARFDVDLVPNGVSGVQRVNFAVPLARGTLTDENQVRVLAGTSELSAGRRALARYNDDSILSVQLQVDVDVSAQRKLTVEIGVPGQGGVSLAPVQDTLTGSGNNVRPRVWAILPTSVMVDSEFAGPLRAKSEFAGTALDAWSRVCDYDRFNTAAFLANASSRDVWLFDRVTALYRGYAMTGQLSPLESAYREASIYRAGMSISNGVATSIPVPGASGDLKYHYSQGMALHYLLTGDDRFREAAEAVSARVANMFNPRYDGGDRFWTERHAGFYLLAHEWAARVTDDQLAAISQRANAAVDAYLEMQMANRFGQTSTTARCFAHTATAHGEGYGTNGCSPWMSAILADALDAHARRVGGQRAEQVRTSLARLGRALAANGRDSTGRPLYWMNVSGGRHEQDYYNEHWGESAYILALAWNVSGKTDSQLRQVADQLVAGMKDRGTAPHVRSFNWQCRSAVMTPALLQ